MVIESIKGHKLNNELIKKVVQESSLILYIGANTSQTVPEYRSINPNVLVVSIEANSISPTRTIDDLCGFQCFDLMKIDTHASAMSVIDVAVNTLSRTKWLLIDALAVECNEGAASANAIIDRLLQIGFESYTPIEDSVFQSAVARKDVLFINSKYDERKLPDTSPRKTLGVKFDLLLWAYNKEKPKYFIEVGTYKCQTSVGLFKNHLPKKAFLLDLFEKASPDELPPEQPPVTADQALKIISENFGNDFDCSVVVGNSFETLPHVINSINSFDDGTSFAFIDGGHSYETAISDLKNVCNIRHELLVAIDDANFVGVNAAINDFIRLSHKRSPIVVAHRPNLVVFKLLPNWKEASAGI